MNHASVASLCAAAAAAMLAACAAPPVVTAPSAPPSASPSPLTRAAAQLFTPDGRAGGQAELTQAAGGVDIDIRVSGLAPGPHGFHVHAHGECAPGPDAATGAVVAFGAAGGHFDPGQSHNHGAPGQPAHEAHAGELPNIAVAANGSGTLRHTNANVSLAPGKRSVLGRTLVVHADADDYRTDPAGNSGARVLCGRIVPAQAGLVNGRLVLEGGNAYPEGVAVDSRSGHAYIGSSREGHIWRVASGTVKPEMFQAGGAIGRQSAYGMKVDAGGRLWVAGGAADTVAVIDTANAATVSLLKGPADSHGFLNDLVLAADGHAYVTDSFRPVLFRARSGAGAAARLEPWLDLSATPVRYQPNEINLNGIVASADGRRLLAIQTVTGQLWRIDTASKAVIEVQVGGGDLKHGDGLVLRGSGDLFVVRNETHEITRVRLSDGWERGQIVERITDARLRYPTTAAFTGQGLLVVNSQLDTLKDPPPVLPFEVLTLTAP